ncbi:hypothetical protein N0V93_006641 [Gnomoniopsis smithogilvyi]|uniref:Uncharacterized protein n=1 Tax=Gnomoniopsis smithogilvyi TaxID=1191159 RepID=A0A9W9CUN8_9PEZI|nr:hypothetical protein N0V93_006641 [Gnomoniopsis smithogilvyi]
MNPHLHLHQGPSDCNPGHGNARSIENSRNSRIRGRFLSKINKFVLRSSQSALKNERSISPSSPTYPFKIIHKRDIMPLYSPPRPMMPRTESECEEALQEMFSYTRDVRRPSTVPSEGPLSRTRILSDQKKLPAPPLPPPKDGYIPPKSFPRLLNTSISLQPPRTAGARLETIPGSPLSPTTTRSVPTPTRLQFCVTPGTPRTVDRNRIQRAMTGDDIRAPRPLSERAMIPQDSLSRLRPGEDAHSARSPLSISVPSTLSPTESMFTIVSEGSESRAQRTFNTKSRPLERVLNPLSPLHQSPRMMFSSSRLTSSTNNETMSPRRPSRPGDQELPPPSPKRPRQHSQLGFHNMHVDDDTATDSEDNNSEDNRTPTPSSSRHTPEFSAKCHTCPEPCSPGHGLCTACQEHLEPHTPDCDVSDSDYEDFDVRTPSLSPRKTKPRPLVLQPTQARGSNGPPASPGPVTPSFSRPITPTRSPRREGTPLSSLPLTPETPRGWSRLSSPPHQASGSQSRSSSSAQSQTLKTLSSPVFIRPSASPGPGSALFHLERSMQWENWEPLTPGASPKNGNDVVRVGSVSGGEVRRMVVRDSNDEGADTMKMLANEEGEELGRSGGGGGYGDWFSYYAEEEEQEALNRTSAGSSIYDRIQSIYDAYAGEYDELEGEEMEMF